MASGLGRRDEVSVLACHDAAAEAELVCRNACHAAAVAELVCHSDDAALGRDEAVAAVPVCRNACRDAHNAAAEAAANACDAYASCSS